jgi:hypothetical protein
MGAKRAIVAGLLLLLVSPALSSEAGPTPTEGSVDRQPVRVYTNADLERFGPVSDTAAPAPEGAGWEFVAEFLEREYGRLDAERAYDLERRRVEAEAEALARRHDHVRLPIVPYLDRTWRRVGPLPGDPTTRERRGRRSHRQSRYGLPSVARPGASSSQGIVPLHARPTLAELHRARAIRHSGADAVPDR